VDALVGYAIEKATRDVAEAIRWLQTEGFRLVRSVGGPGESFGNVLLTFERHVQVTVVRDRGQWLIDIASSAGAESHGLDVWMSAMSGTEPDPGTPEELFRELPDQLPKGVLWRTELPTIVRWIESGDRSNEIAEADSRWRGAMRKYLKPSSPRDDSDQADAHRDR
jgi:hypothetical protein